MFGGFVSWVRVSGKIWGFSWCVGKAHAVGVSIKVWGLGGIVSGVRAGNSSSCFRNVSEMLAKNLLTFGKFPYFSMNSLTTSSGSRTSSFVAVAEASVDVGFSGAISGCG